MTILKYLRFLKDKLETPYVVSYFLTGCYGVGAAVLEAGERRPMATRMPCNNACGFGGQPGM